MFSSTFDLLMKGNEYPMHDCESFSDLIYDEQTQMAERELFSFITAVEQLYGSEQARLSEMDWLDESESMDSPTLTTRRDWRTVTIAASARLADRLSIALTQPSSAIPN
jgi:hypothetical protein